MRDLKRQLQEAPRPALWREMCKSLLHAGQLARAEECCQEWLAKGGEPEAVLMLAHVRLERFFADRNREEGRRALEALDRARQLLPRDPRHWRLRLQFACRIGAWEEARQSAVRLLELEPGDPALEARFRTLQSRAPGSPDVEQALREIERTGVFRGENDSDGERGRGGLRNVRPVLKSLAAARGVHAALYVRGGTALVQGPRGASAERTARAVRSIVQTGRSTARRLGLGQISQVVVESEHGGTLSVAAGEMDAGALWCKGQLSRGQERALKDLAGLDAVMEEVET